MGRKRHGSMKKRSARKRQPKRRHNASGRRVPSSVLGRLQQQWPFHEVLVNENWRSSGGLIQLVVSRRAEESGDIVAGVLLVDLGRGITRANSKIIPGLARNVLSLPAYAQEKPCCRDIRPIQSP